MLYKLTLGAVLVSTLLGCGHSPTSIVEPSKRTAEVGAGPAFPLKLSSNRRYLVDQNNAPFLINQASSWGLIQSLSTADATEYLDDLKQRGFNTVMVSIISYDTRMAGNPPNWQGVPPFKVQWDYSTYNDAYFDHADTIINLARDRGMLVTLVPSYLGYPGEPTQGWFDEMLSSNNSSAKSRAYGNYLGARYKNFDNIVWIAGGDNSPAPGSALEDRLKAIIDGIRENDSAHLWTAHWDSVAHGNGVLSTENSTFASYMNINGYYAYDYGLTYQRNLQAYNMSPPMMTYNLDQSYETEPGGTPDNIRRKAYQVMMMGGAGSSFCAGRDWWSFTNWRNMNTPGTQQTQLWYQLFSSRAWFDLVPDQSHAVLTAGFGNWGDLNYVAAARTSSGSTVMAFLPTSHTVTVDLSKVSGSQAKVWWYNPSNGQATLSGTFANSGAKDLTPPGSGDWLLVIDDASLNLPAPGSQNAATSSPPTVAAPATAGSNPTTGTSSALSVLGADDGGEASLTYVWSATSVPTGGSVSFASNNSNAAKNTSATFTRAGTYTLQAAIVDSEGQTTGSSVVVGVQQTITNLSVSPASVTLAPNTQQRFSATVNDQFGAPMSAQPTVSWATSGGGSIAADGLLTAGSAAGGPFTVSAQAGGKTGTANFTVSASTGTNSFHIDSGGAAIGAFAADQSFEGGYTYATSSAVATAGVANAAPAAVYQSERYGDVRYTLSGLVSGASYLARLHFAEIYHSAANSRLFNVSINGQQVLANFDVFAAAGGALKAIVRDFTTTADVNGQVVIALTGVKDQAKISALELFSGSAGAGAPPPDGGSADAGAPPPDGGSSDGGPALSGAAYQIAAGGGAVSPFSADQYFSGGNTYSTSNPVSTAGVANAAPAAVYQSERFGDSSYTLGGLTANAPYVVRLHFAEIYWSAADSRLFNVAINGARVLDSFDVFLAAGGANKAVVRDFSATASASGQVSIEFTTVKDNAKVSGIELLQ